MQLNSSINTVGAWGGRNPPQYLGARGKHPPIKFGFTDQQTLGSRTQNKSSESNRVQIRKP